MPLKQRALTLTAVVAIPLGIAATSYALTDTPPAEKAPAEVRMESGTPSAGPTSSPKDEVVSPRPQDADDADDDAGGGRDDADDDRDDGPAGASPSSSGSAGADDEDDGSGDD
ncbi:small secreted hydrophilic protein [Streptomyces macrosporus]|uniref:Small secreted hydrophilic protein n=1 Tax=Streptomyces macrosporus TaxID=44032 RepID=A0ABN3JL30_9ACTN